MNNKQELLIEPIPEAKLREIVKLSWHSISANLYFSSDEIQRFLIARGYKMAILRGEATIHLQTHDGGEVRNTGEKFEALRELVIAVKSTHLSLDRDELPTRVDSEEASEMSLLAVFQREFKNRLLEKL